MTQRKNQIEAAAKVLGVAPSAGLPVVKAAYRGQVKKYHPDVTPASNGAASSRLLAVLDAFEVLANPELRAQYDAAVAKQAKLPKLAEPPKPPPSRGVAVARGALAAVILGCWGFMAALATLLLAILVGVAVGIIK
jgi:curved DNA-binding protein CbpA